jgi:hypothetical protein
VVAGRLLLLPLLPPPAAELSCGRWQHVLMACGLLLLLPGCC